MITEEPLDKPLDPSKDDVYQGNSFSVRNGYCHVLKDRLVITPNENPSVEERDVGSENAKRNWILLASLGAAIICGLGAFYVGSITPRPRTGFLPPEVVLAFVSVAALVSFGFNFRLSFAPEIRRDSIQKITYYNGFGAGQPNMFKRSRIAIHFTDENKRIRKRTLVMPNRFNGGRIEMRKALTILRREGLLKE